MLRSTHRSAVSSTATAPLPAGWTEHKAPTGHSYYYNSETQQSTYTRPSQVPEESLQIDYNAVQPAYTTETASQPYAFPSTAFFDSGQHVDRGQGHFRGGRSYQDRSRNKREDRPRSKSKILNCEPWLLVKTKFGRRFVHNTETKESLWKFPPDVMMAVIEMDRQEWEANKREERSKEAPKAVDHAAKVVPRPIATHNVNSDSYEEVEVTDDETEDADPAAKRAHTASPAAPPGPVEFNEDDIAFQLAAMGEEYGLESGEYHNPDAEMEEDQGLALSAEDAVNLFRDLLDDSRINPYSTLDKLIEEGQIVDDNRYTVLPSMARRREVFDEWSRDRIAQLQQDRAQQIHTQKDPKIEYLRLLSERASVKLFWAEFKRKFRKEEIMKDLRLSEKEKEKMYRDLVGRLKTAESERKKDLVGLLRQVGLSDLHRQTALDGLPVALEGDIRFWAVPKKAREELVEAHIASLPDI